MSFPSDNEPIHNSIHLIEIDDGNHPVQTENLNITVRKNYKDMLLMKLRDEKNIHFNYSTVINRENFPFMKKEQSLDIDFDEFEQHLLEMLLMNLSKKMLMKCEVNSDYTKCRIIFYEKSKIKNLILLSIEMTITTQKDLIEEIESNMRKLKETNKGLLKQIMTINEKLAVRDQELSENMMYTGVLEQKFKKDMQNVNRVFSNCLQQCEFLLNEKICEISNKIVKVISNVNTVKNYNLSKSESNTKLLKSMENLRLENLDNLTLIDKLKLDCMALEKMNKKLESDVLNITTRNKENEKKIVEFQEQIAEYRSDLENSAIAIAKKTEQFNELKADMEQANQVIRNYNKHYDSKAQEVEELIELIKSKDNLIKEQIFQNNQLFKEYHEYKAKFSVEEMEKLTMELTMAQDKIKNLEKEKREMVKLNGLLTKKISSSSLFSDQKI